MKKSYSEIKETINVISYNDLLGTQEWETKRKHIIDRDKKECKSCQKSFNSQGEYPYSLHVHHKYYIVGFLPWDYEDSALETFCENCHSNLHYRSTVPIYIIKNGIRELINGTPCKRCGGSGYIPEHRKIENGICFRCRGRRFEELIYFFIN